MSPETIFPDFTSSHWILVCGFLSTAFFSQLTRDKSVTLKVAEILALIAGSCFTLINAPWIFAFAVVLFNLGLLLRLKASRKAQKINQSTPPVQGASGS